MVYSAKSDSSNTISQFTRRREITITPAGTSTPADYQVKLTITYEPGMQADFDDIRFNTKARGYIDYWIESYVASTSAVVWVELSDAITDGNSDTIWMYYGNSGLSDGGVGDDTFDFFDDFSGDLSKWNITGTVVIDTGRAKISGNNVYGSNGMTTIDTFSKGIILEYDVYQAGLYHAMNGFSVQPLDINKGIFWNLHTTGNFYYRVDSVSNFLGTYTAGATDNVKWILPLGNGFSLYRNDVLRRTDTSWTNPNSANRPTFMQYTAGVFLYIDNVRIRKYAANEPTASYGTAQHQRRVPTFL